MGHFRIFLSASVAVCAVGWPTGSVLAAEDAPRFNRDIRPILADKCYACHGPDSGTRKADLRLDTEAGSHESAIVAGDPDSSELVRRVSSNDPEERMPPAAAKKPPLTKEQIELVRKWIKAGAKYEPFWAYIPPQRQSVPQVKHTAWPRNDIDRFLLAKQEAQKLGPGPAADRVTLVRRLYFDLTGLPPTLTQVQEFASDSAPDAY